MKGQKYTNFNPDHTPKSEYPELPTRESRRHKLMARIMTLTGAAVFAATGAMIFDTYKNIPHASDKAHPGVHGGDKSEYLKEALEFEVEINRIHREALVAATPKPETTDVEKEKVTKVTKPKKTKRPKRRQASATEITEEDRTWRPRPPITQEELIDAEREMLERAARETREKAARESGW